MYRLLLITQPTEATDLSQWKAQNFGPVVICQDTDAALEALSKKAFDAIGVADQASYQRLHDTLTGKKDCTPMFMLPNDATDLPATIKDVRHLLHRLHVDYIDEDYTLSELSRIIQYEMIHNLIAGKSNDAEKLIRWFKMLRSEIPTELPCRVYSLGLPQGDLYLTDHWHHGPQRLQKALEYNFFSHIDHIRYCAVSFINPIEARLILIPDASCNIFEMSDTLDDAVIHTINEIKSYLELDIDVYQAGTAACIADITMSNNEKEE